MKFIVTVITVTAVTIEIFRQLNLHFTIMELDSKFVKKYFLVTCCLIILISEGKMIIVRLLAVESNLQCLRIEEHLTAGQQDKTSIFAPKKLTRICFQE